MMGQPSGWGRGRFYLEGARPLYPRPTGASTANCNNQS